MAQEIKQERTLDRTRDYGTVIGDPKIGFDQDGAFFAHDGSFINIWATPETLARERAQRESRLAKEAASARQRAILQQRQRLLEQA